MIFYRNKEIGATISYQKIKRTLQRCKAIKSNIKRRYSSIRALYEHIVQYPYLLKFKVGEEIISFDVVLINSSTKTDHLLIYNSQLLSELNNNNDIFVDATFDSTPNVGNVHQLLTIMSKKYNIVSIHF